MYREIYEELERTGRVKSAVLGSLTAWVHRMPLKALLGFIFFVNF